MLEVRGKYNQAKIFTDQVDEASIAQVVALCNQEFTQGSRIRLMPDVHAGAGCTVGTTMTITDRVVPNLVGVDIGCGMETARLGQKELDLQALDRLIYDRIPSGFSIRNRAHPYAAQIDLKELCCFDKIDFQRAQKSIGTLGGGNHFIEAGRDGGGGLYLVVHSGSRRLGLEVANHYQRAGFDALKGAGSVKGAAIPRELAYVQGDLFRQYIHDMQIVQRYARLNRRAMMDEIAQGLGLEIVEQFTTIHNYIDTDAMILRKGAVSAKAGEKLLIPINMRDGCLICTGLGNEDWNCSAPHGAGRLMSRSQAKQSFTVEEFHREMEGIFTTSVGKSTLDECPMAYKDMSGIVENIGPTAKIEAIVKPIYNFKAGGD